MTREVLQGAGNEFGPRTSNVDAPRFMPEGGLVKTLILSLTTVAGSAAMRVAPVAGDATEQVIPAYSYIKSVSIHVQDAFTSTATATGIDVGLVKASDLSTEVDLNGFIAVGGVGAKANLAANISDAGDGALIGNSIAFDSVFKAAWAVGTDTLTGTAVVVVEYIPPLQHMV